MFSDGGCALEVGHVIIASEVTFRLQLYISIASQGDFGMEVGICDLATVAGSTAGNLFPSLGASCYVAYQLQGTTTFPLLQGFGQTLAMLSPVHRLCRPP